MLNWAPGTQYACTVFNEEMSKNHRNDSLNEYVCREKCVGTQWQKSETEIGIPRKLETSILIMPRNKVTDRWNCSSY